MEPEQNKELQQTENPNNPPYSNQQTQTNTPIEPNISPSVQNTDTTIQPKKSKKLLVISIISVALLIICVITASFIFLAKDKPAPNNSVPSKDIEASETIEPVEPQEQETSLKENQINNSYRNDASRFLSYIIEYMADNNGAVPNTAIAQDILLQSGIKSPLSDEAYTIVETDPLIGQIQYKASSTCTEDNTIIAGRNRREIAVRMQLSDGSYTCVS